MLSEIKFSYENVGSTSYLAVTFPEQVELVHYQMEMLSENEISNLLSMNKKVMNGEVTAYYNISSKVSMSQILVKRKLSRQEFRKFLEGIIHAAEDGNDYQLPMEGLVLDTKYIYMDPSVMMPFFVYLPVKNKGENGLRELMLSLIMEGKIELTGDNFVQLLLEAVNRQPFRIDDLKAVLAATAEKKNYHAQNLVFDPVADSKKMAAAGVEEGKAPVPGNAGNPAQALYMPSASEKPGEVPLISPVERGRKPDLPDGRNMPGENEKMSETVKTDRSFSGKKKKEKLQAGKTKSVSKQTPKDSEGFDSEKARKKFLLPQAGVMVILAALISFGAFKNEAGGIAIKNVLAVILLVAVGEIILYREIYVNTKEKTGKKQKKPVQARNLAESQQKAVPVPPSGFGKAGARPEVPKMPVNQPIPEIMKKEPEIVPQKPVFQKSFVQPEEIEPTVVESFVTEGDETELWDGTQNRMGACLEYYENGQLSRVSLDKESTLVGRMRGQVDFAVNNPKVGKIHAEFLNQNGNIYVKDINSKNGTYINGDSQRIGSNIPYPLKHNDKIMLADSEFTLKIGS